MNFFAEVWDFWVETWKTDRVLFWCEAIGALLGAWSATHLGIYANDPNMWLVLVPWGVSAMLMVYASYKRRSAWIMLIMSYYAVNNFIGVINLIIG